MVSKGTGVSVLIAEDETLCSNVLSSLLKSLGAISTVTADGQLCLDEFKTNPTKYNLILMDITMPNMDGYQATEEIRKINPSIKIVGLTGDDDEETKEKALKSGMSSIQKKPVKKADLQALIKWKLIHTSHYV